MLCHRRTGDPTIPLKDLRQACGYVPQDNFLFSDTISANIAFGDRSKTQAQIEEAAKAACVHDNIVDFADGMIPWWASRASPSPAGRSGVAIARPSSSTRRSSSGRFGLRRGYRHRGKDPPPPAETRQGKTNITIAHRISTLQDADQIIVIDEGHIAERHPPGAAGQKRHLCRYVQPPAAGKNETGGVCVMSQKREDNAAVNRHTVGGSSATPSPYIGWFLLTPGHHTGHRGAGLYQPEILERAADDYVGKYVQVDSGGLSVAQLREIRSEDIRGVVRLGVTYLLTVLGIMV